MTELKSRALLACGALVIKLNIYLLIQMTTISRNKQGTDFRALYICASYPEKQPRALPRDVDTKQLTQ